MKKKLYILVFVLLVVSGYFMTTSYVLLPHTLKNHSSAHPDHREVRWYRTGTADHFYMQTLGYIMTFVPQMQDALLKGAPRSRLLPFNANYHRFTLYIGTDVFSPIQGNGRFEYGAGTHPSNTVIMTTERVFSGTTIMEADIMYNINFHDKGNISGALFSMPLPGDFDWVTATRHEVGHAIGHDEIRVTNQSNLLMYVSFPRDTRKHFDLDYDDGLNCIYTGTCTGGAIGFECELVEADGNDDLTEFKWSYYHDDAATVVGFNVLGKDETTGNYQTLNDSLIEFTSEVSDYSYAVDSYEEDKEYTIEIVHNTGIREFQKLK